MVSHFRTNQTEEHCLQLRELVLPGDPTTVQQARQFVGPERGRPVWRTQDQVGEEGEQKEVRTEPDD